MSKRSRLHIVLSIIVCLGMAVLCFRVPDQLLQLNDARMMDKTYRNEAEEPLRFNQEVLSLERKIFIFNDIDSRLRTPASTYTDQHRENVLERIEAQLYDVQEKKLIPWFNIDMISESNVEAFRYVRYDEKQNQMAEYFIVWQLEIYDPDFSVTVYMDDETDKIIAFSFVQSFIPVSVMLNFEEFVLGWGRYLGVDLEIHSMLDDERRAAMEEAKEKQNVDNVDNDDGFRQNLDQMIQHFSEIRLTGSDEIVIQFQIDEHICSFGNLEAMKSASSTGIY